MKYYYITEVDSTNNTISSAYNAYTDEKYIAYNYIKQFSDKTITFCEIECRDIYNFRDIVFKKYNHELVIPNDSIIRIRSMDNKDICYLSESQIEVYTWEGYVYEDIINELVNSFNIISILLQRYCRIKFDQDIFLCIIRYICMMLFLTRPVMDDTDSNTHILEFCQNKVDPEYNSILDIIDEAKALKYMMKYQSL